jgi:hypothetical protein
MLVGVAIMRAFGLTAVLVYAAGLTLLRLIPGYARNERLRRKAGLRPRHVPWVMLLIAGVPLLAVALYVGIFLHKFGLPPEICPTSLAEPTPYACYWAKIRWYRCIYVAGGLVGHTDNPQGSRPGAGFGGVGVRSGARADLTVGANRDIGLVGASLTNIRIQAPWPEQ